MTAPSNQYLRTGSASVGGFANSGAGAEAESVHDMLNNMHPAVAVMHAIFDQPMTDSVKPTEMIDYHDIDRSASATTLTNFALQAGQATTVAAAKYPDRLFTRLQTFHEGLAVSRESQQIKLYGVTDAADYGLDNLLVRHMDIWERILHFSQGTEDLTGAAGTPAGPKPRTQGLISWAAWTGLERRHATSAVPTVVGDGLQGIKKTYWTSFYNAGGTPLSRDLLYNQIIGPAWTLGHDSDGAMLMCGPKMMNSFADFNFVPGRGVINEREIPARDQAIEDIVTVITTPANGTLFLVPDRYLGIEGASIVYDNTTFARPTTEAASDNLRGTISAANNGTVYVDETILSVMPSKFKIQTMQGLSYKPLSTDGDYALGMLVAQKGLSCQNLFGICGATNLVP